MTVAVLVSCDRIRPASGERCRAYLATPIADPAATAVAVNAAGWRRSPTGDLCPSCVRATSEESSP